MALEPEERRTEKALEAEAEAAKPAILGALFDAVAAGLAKQGGVTLNRLPRMADFARWGVATEEALGGEPGSFMAACEDSQEEAVETALESLSVAAIVRTFAKGYSQSEPWTGTATELLEALSDRAGEDIKRGRDWPKAPNKLTEQLMRLAPALLEVGVQVVRTSRSGRGRYLQVFSVGAA